MIAVRLALLDVGIGRAVLVGVHRRNAIGRMHQVDVGIVRAIAGDAGADFQQQRIAGANGSADDGRLRRPPSPPDSGSCRSGQRGCRMRETGEAVSASSVIPSLARHGTAVPRPAQSTPGPGEAAGQDFAAAAKIFGLSPSTRKSRPTAAFWHRPIWHWGSSMPSLRRRRRGGSKPAKWLKAPSSAARRTLWTGSCSGADRDEASNS